MSCALIRQVVALFGDVKIHVIYFCNKLIARDCSRAIRECGLYENINMYLYVHSWRICNNEYQYSHYNYMTHSAPILVPGNRFPNVTMLH